MPSDGTEWHYDVSLEVMKWDAYAFVTRLPKRFALNLVVRTPLDIRRSCDIPRHDWNGPFKHADVIEKEKKRQGAVLNQGRQKRHENQM